MDRQSLSPLRRLAGCPGLLVSLLGAATLPRRLARLPSVQVPVEHWRESELSRTRVTVRTVYPFRCGATVFIGSGRTLDAMRSRLLEGAA
ncbi:MAG: hypothetical protein QOH75_1668 [Actinomycetota bacterium]|nr:hypothetical protein [Actinomycetota bacterium]